MMEPTRLEQSTWLRFVLRGAHILEGPGRRLLQLNASNLLAAARRRTHLHDFGDPALQEPLRRLVQSVEGEARLNFIGRLAAREDLTHMLMNRLKMERGPPAAPRHHGRTDPTAALHHRLAAHGLDVPARPAGTRSR
jgi:hypothetical protein